ncbi:hypothetical protein, partial [Pseudomonas viridiflava]|uniref:hypothetical protein n=1 Tax=Pseudomonas viridiflava TaxID=33069 RepID=UPI00197E6844
MAFATVVFAITRMSSSLRHPYTRAFLSQIQISVKQISNVEPHLFQVWPIAIFPAQQKARPAE